MLVIMNKNDSMLLEKIALISLLPCLLTGTIFFEERLKFYPGFEFSLNTFLYVFSLFLFIYDKSFKKKRIFAILCVVVIVVIFHMRELINTGDISGYLKYYDSIGLGLLTGMIWFELQKKGYGEFVLFAFIATFIVLLILALRVKFQTGLFDRHNPYFMHGSIVFGRLMGFGFFLVLISQALPFFLKYFFLLLFALSVFWSMSKGPVLGLIVGYGIWLLLNHKSVMKKGPILGFVLLIVALYFVLGSIELPKQFDRLMILFSAEKYAEVDISGTLTVREMMWQDTFELLKDNLLFGIGPLEWSRTIGNTLGNFTYPHNLFLELFVDLGVFAIIGIFFFTLPFFSFRCSYFPLFLFFFISQMVSGDIADGRFLILIGYLIILDKRPYRYEG